jgi:hypothetical protein
MSTQLFAKSFYGYNCTEDCSGHEAGYAWAETNDIHYEGDCIGKSKSFIEGCLAYIEDNENILEFYRFDEDGNILHEEDY